MIRKHRHRSGSASVEFALVCAVYSLCALLILCLATTLAAKAVAEMTAWETARCTAIGSGDCPRPDDFARQMVRKWGGALFAPSIAVTTSPATECDGPSGVAVNLTFDATLLTGRLIGRPLAANACFPLVSRR